MTIVSNEFTFLTLNDKSDWNKQLLSFCIDVSELGIAIEKTIEYESETILEPGQLPDQFVIQDMVIGPCNLLYVLDARGNILVLAPKHKKLQQIKCINLPQDPTGIAFYPGNFYIAIKNKGQKSKAYSNLCVLNYAQINWQVRWITSTDRNSVHNELDLLEFPSNNPVKDKTNTYIVEPDQLAVDSKGNLYILDSHNTSILKFDHRGYIVDKIDKRIFGDISGDLTDIAIANGDKIYVLAKTNQKVLEVDFNTKTVKEAINRLPWKLSGGLAVDSKGNFYIGILINNELYIVQVNQLNQFNKYKLLKKPIMVSDSAHVQKLLIDNKENIYALITKENLFSEIVTLKPVTKLMKYTNSTLPNGTYYSGAFDSTKKGTQWHKLVLDAEIPENTQIKVSYLVADDKKVVEDKIKGVSPNELNWSPPLINPRDALIQAHSGQYLWLKIELTGWEQLTPTLKSVQVYLPRMSYLRYLPAVYQEDENSRQFLEGFLSLFETFFTDMERQIDHIERYFDIDVVSGEFLRWLGSWLAVPGDENWPEDKFRQLVKNAHQFYSKRGTRAGIEEMVELYTGDTPFIIEHFQLEKARQKSGDLYKELLNCLYGNNPYIFTVLLNPVKVNGECFELRSYTDTKIQTVRRIINSEKPAHTSANVILLQPWVYLDMHTYLGVNSCLSKPTPALNTGAMIPRDTVLTNIEKAGQIESHSRLEMGTYLT